MHPANPPPPSSTRAPRLLLVVGSGRSGTSTVAGVLKQLGMHVPQPEWPANDTNPRGFHEPEWVVLHQRRLLSRATVALDDARPAAFELTRELADRPRVREAVANWLRENVVEQDESIVKDPRNSWFLPMWQEAAATAGAVPCFVTMLRHPAEVVGSKNTYYRPMFGAASRTANWLNINLHSEYTTRGTSRVFVDYPAMLQDWHAVVGHMATVLDLRVLDRATPAQLAAADDFVEPGLRRVQATWADLDVPAALQEMTEAVWQQLATLRTAADGRDAEAEAQLDGLREAYRDLYESAEAVSQSTSLAARTEARRAARREAAQAADKPASTAEPQRQPAKAAARRARRVASRLRGG